MSRLLLVDDDKDDVQLTMLGFRDEKLDCEVLVAVDGQHALDLLLADYAAGRPLPDAVLLDLKMPRVDGLELLGRLKGDPRLRKIPAAVFTSSGHETDMTEAMRLGADLYLRKPSSLRDYAAIVRQVRELMGVKAPR